MPNVDGGSLWELVEQRAAATPDALVHAPEEVDRLQVLVPAEAVRNPLAGLARVVEIEHRRDRIDAQPVEMIVLEPEAGIGDEEGRDLLAAVIVDVCAPVLMEALARIGVLVEMGAVEERRDRAGRWEMAGNPVEDQSDPASCAASTNAAKSSGDPKRLVGAKSETGW